MNIPVSFKHKKIYFSWLPLFLSGQLLFAANKTDSLKQKIGIAVSNVDDLKQQLKTATNDSLKGPLYSRIAAQYLNYDTITNKKTRLEYQEAALR